MAANNFWDLEKDGPAQFAFPISPVDSANLAQPARGLYVGVGGNLKVIFSGMNVGSPVTLGGLSGGVVYPFAVSKVFSGSTTCASIVGLR